MAPEQASADPHLDHRADLYSVGAMAYEMLCGTPPFTGNNAQQVLVAHLTKPPEPLAARRPGLPPLLEQAIMRCLAKQPADRYQTADELLAALEPSRLSSDAHTPVTLSVPTVMPAKWYGHPAVVALGYAVVVALVLGAVSLIGRAVGMPGWVTPAAAGLLVLGLPIAVVTGRLERKRAVAMATGMYHPSGEAPAAGFFTWKRALVAGMIAFAALGLGAGAWAAMRTAGIGPAGTLLSTGKLAAKSGVVVAEFENRTADSTLGPSVSEALRIDLSQSPVISVLSAQELQQALALMGKPGARVTGALARDVATRANANAVITGEIGQVGQGMVLLARLVSTSDGTELLALRETANTPADVLSALDRLSKRLRERIGESLKGLRNSEPLEQVSTSSLEALRYYTEGVRLTDDGHYDDAIAPLRRAVAADSTFAMAWRKLAVVIGNARLPEAERIEAATKAFTYRDRLPEVERYLAIAFYYFVVEHDRDQVIAAYRAVLQLDPNNDAALNNLAIELQQAGQLEESAQLAERAIARRKIASFYSVLLNARMRQGRLADGLAVTERMRRDLPTAPEPPMLHAGVLARMGRYDSARAEFESVLRGNPPAAVAQTSAMWLYTLDVAQGRLDAATREAARFRQVAAARGNAPGLLQADIGEAYQVAVVRQDPATAKRMLAAIDARHALDSLAPADRPYGYLVEANVRAGNVARARQLVAEYERVVPAGLRKDSTDALYMRLSLALGEGRPRDAIATSRAIRATNRGCARCARFEEGLAWEQLHEPDSARAAYEAKLTPAGEMLDFITADAYELQPVHRQLGAIYESKGEKAKAIEQYTAFLDGWRNADPVLQPQVNDVKERLARLVGEGSR
jgi:tetratricopeptide (TPR) repeat protein